MRRYLLCALMLLPMALLQAPLTAQDDKPAAESPPPLKGVVVRVDDERLVVAVKAKGEKPTEHVVRTSASTVVRVDGERSKLAAIEPGMSVTVPAHEGTAARVTATSPRIRGAFVRLDGDTVVMRVKVEGDNESEMRVPTTSRTAVRVDGEKATLADIKPGMTLSVPKFKESAKRVDARTPKSGTASDSADDADAAQPRKAKDKDAKSE